MKEWRGEWDGEVYMCGRVCGDGAERGGRWDRDGTRTHTHTHTLTCKMVMLMLVEVSPSPIATEPVVGVKSAPGTASWSAGSPEAIAVLNGREEEEEEELREKKGKIGRERREKERGEKEKGRRLHLASAAC